MSALSEGDLVLVRPGASIPADEIVRSGKSDVNESMITGESVPVKKAAIGYCVALPTTAAVGEHQFVDVTPTFVQPSMSDSGEVIDPARPY